jgi:Mycoplasma protein of unknown function, DUF285./Bacterial Ig-like domain (group 2).
VVDWGDGVIETFPGSVESTIDHTYTDNDVYYIELKPSKVISDLRISGGVTEVIQWSSAGYSRLVLGGLNGAEITKVPNIAPVGLTDYTDLLSNLPSFNDVSVVSWNTASATNMHGLLAQCPTFNQDISSWSVLNVESMDYMLDGALAFNRDLSWWCVSKIAQQPIEFANGSPLQDDYYPVWGTCPSRNYQLDITPNNPTVAVGEEVTLAHTLTPTDTVVKTTWVSADPSIATVTEEGVLAGVAVGTTYIYLDLNGKYTQSIEVTVVTAGDDPAKATNLKIVDLRAPTDISAGLNI